MSALPATSREIRLTARPEGGLIGPDHLTVVDTPVPTPAPGEVLVRNRFFAVHPALRTLVGGVEGAPFPALRPGDTLFGPAVGEVVATADGGPAPGTLVTHTLGWREHAAVPVAHLAPADPTLPDAAAHLAQGPVAYGALTRAAALREGDTVLVTGGAGAVGSMAGPIARLLGAGRVIGTTGSPWKAERMTADLGYDAVVPRGGDGSFTDRLAAAAPDGIDVLVDTVGGDQLAAALDLARDGARFALVGSLSGQLDPGTPGVTAPVTLDGFRAVLRRVTLRGYSPLDDGPALTAEWNTRFADWLARGLLAFPHTRIAGMHRAPAALTEVMSGRYVGAVLIEP
ncbi:MDR family NADP-dependent oxidoreductase [Nocardiopsis protaetiae]|uniref:MDR family NADP-dependent oxidoreductase n=1 Tax=Nocardiopsis protaetiae TaxID=3382270 RepID=UPI00387A95E0